MKNIFLKTEWRKLIMINYEVQPALLQPYLPKGTELDSWNGKYFVSVVGFKFINTKVKGIKFPFHINFEQVNLRFYVKRILKNEIRHGVVFIKEIIDKPLIKFIARNLYKENYVTMSMQHHWEINNDTLNISYQWKTNNKWNKISVKSKNELNVSEIDSEERFISEHYWGYIQVNKNKSYEFRVEHPAWKIYTFNEPLINVDFKATYGSAFDCLKYKQPSSAFLVEGSEVFLGDKNLIT